MLGRSEWGWIAASAVVEAVAVLSVYLGAATTSDPETARTVAFCTLVASELLRVLAFRSRTQVLPEVGMFGNVPLLAVVAGSLLAQVALTEVPAAARVFYLVPLSAGWWALVFAGAFVPVSVLEVMKLARRVSR